MKKILIIALVATSLFGCKKVEFDPNLSEYNKNLLVVEGLITNSSEFQYVKLTRTASYMGNQEIVAVNDASVRVECDGTTYTFMNSGNGKYEAPAGFVGEIGKTYHLMISQGGNLYESSSTMKQPLIIDSINMIKDDYNKKKYMINAWFQDNMDKDEYFLFKYAINNTLQDSIKQWGRYLDILSNNYYFEDVTVTNNVNAIFGDSISLYTFSISKEYFDFLTVAEKNMQEPIPFLPPPGARIKGNVSNGALGFFQASAVFQIKTKLKI